MLRDVDKMRQNYAQGQLTEDNVLTGPFEQFALWFEQAREAQIYEANAMTIATADADGRPSARTVLLKGFDKDGFVFYTNYGSDKGQDLAANPYCSLLFFWKELERQVRIEGVAERVPAEVSLAYFQSRPKDSQIAAWASNQSATIADRAAIETNFAAIAERFADAEALPLPPNWGGYLIRPNQIEFWQGRPNRMHDRLRYRFAAGAWLLERLAP